MVKFDGSQYATNENWALPLPEGRTQSVCLWECNKLNILIICCKLTSYFVYRIMCDVCECVCVCGKAIEICAYIFDYV